MAWKEITEERFMDMLEMLPPVAQCGYGFMLGEPWTHDSLGNPMFRPFVETGDKFYEGSAPMTVREFRTLNLSTLQGA